MTAIVTETCVPTKDAQSMLSAFVSHIESDHEVDMETDQAGARYIENAGFRITLSAKEEGLGIHISGPNPEMMVFFKDAVVQHVAAFDPEIASALRWSGETAKAGDLPENFRVLRLLRKSHPMPGLVRVTVTSDDDGLFSTQGIHLKMMLPETPGRAPVWPSMGENGAPVWPQGDDRLHARYLTIRHVRPSVREMDLDVVEHGDGLISSWASHANIGEDIGAMGPAGEAVLPLAQDYLLASDLTGAPALARYLENMPPNTNGQVLCEASDLEQLSEYLPQTHFALTPIPSTAFSTVLREAVNNTLRPGRTDYALFTGEFDDAQYMRKIFKGPLGLGKGQQISVAYWRRGQVGFEA